MTEGQRVALQQVENVKAEERDGTTYWTYEHLSQVRPAALDSILLVSDTLRRPCIGRKCSKFSRSGT